MSGGVYGRSRRGGGYTRQGTTLNFSAPAAYGRGGALGPTGAGVILTTVPYGAGFLLPGMGGGYRLKKRYRAPKYAPRRKVPRRGGALLPPRLP